MGSFHLKKKYVLVILRLLFYMRWIDIGNDLYGTLYWRHSRLIKMQTVFHILSFEISTILNDFHVSSFFPKH